MATLVIDTGTGSELSFELEAEATSIGASSGNDVVLRVPGVAPNHVVLRRSGGRYTFLGQQRQVVLVNGKRRARGVIGEGDRIRIGTATLYIRYPEGKADEVGAEAPAELEAPLPAEAVEPEPVKARAELVLFNEPPRLAAARRRLLEAFREGPPAELSEKLEGFLESAFPGRRAMLAWLDQQGLLQPVVASWSGPVPHLPPRTFSELDQGDRLAVLRGSGRELLIYPVPGAAAETRIYVLAESSPDEREEDRTLVAELAAMVAARWQDFVDSSAVLGRWEEEARARIEARLPGSSPAVRALRDGMLAAARSPRPVLLYGPPGSGRAFLGSLVASLRPTGRPWIRVVQVRGGDDRPVAAELFGSETAIGARGLAEHAGGGAVVIREVQRMSAGLQAELAAAIEHDLGVGYGAKVRWILTADAGGVESSGGIESSLLDLARRHLLRVPSLEERREDLPLIIVRMLAVVGAEQGKEVRGIELDTLDSLLGHTFAGQMTELLGELRRLVSATVAGETVRGVVRGAAAPAERAPAEAGARPADEVGVLDDDDLKVVIPAVERLLIDRVLRRARGNQSRAARELNLSRGALIAKIKDYDIPDYRSLRRKS